MNYYADNDNHPLVSELADAREGLAALETASALRPAPEAPNKTGYAARHEAGDDKPYDQIDDRRHTPVHSDLDLLLLEREERLERSDKPLRNAMDKRRNRIVQIGPEDDQEDAEDDRGDNNARDYQDDSPEPAHRSDLYLDEVKTDQATARGADWGTFAARRSSTPTRRRAAGATLQRRGMFCSHQDGP
jgi:hypothetical protein